MSMIQGMFGVKSLELSDLCDCGATLTASRCLYSSISPQKRSATRG